MGTDHALATAEAVAAGIRPARLERLLDRAGKEVREGLLPAAQLALAHEEIGAVCGNTRGFLAVHTGLVSQCLERHGTEAQLQRWLPRLTSGELIGCFGLTEEEAGSDVASLAAAARPSRRIRGRSRFSDQRTRGAVRR